MNRESLSHEAMTMATRSTSLMNTENLTLPHDRCLRFLCRKVVPEWQFHIAEIQLVYKGINRHTFGKQHSPTYVENTFPIT